jgi:phosphate:Na+ symporter
MPDKEKDKNIVKYIDKSSLELPDIALWQAKNEIIRLAKIINDEMFTNMLRLMERNEISDYLYEKEKIVDEIYLKITQFLTGLIQNKLNEEQSEKQVMYLSICKDLEHVGDIVFGTARHTRKMDSEGVVFSNDDWEELKNMQLKIKSNFNKIIEAVADDDSDAAAELLKRQPEMARAEKNLRFEHFMRISCRDSEDLENTSFYLDFSDRLFRINQHLVSIAQAVLGIV